MASVRLPAVAGSFYPENQQELEQIVKEMLDSYGVMGLAPKAIIAPHAGYIFSGPVAASVYQLLAEGAERIRRVVLCGPTHRVPVNGCAVPSVEQFATPLGNITLDLNVIEELLTLPFVNINDQAHNWEHSLEVHLPFLQILLKKFQLVPIVAGHISAVEMSQVLEQSWGSEETLIVVSTDLSHFHSYDEARIVDERTNQLIEQYDENLTGDQACGCYSLNGLMHYAREHQLNIKTLCLKNSGDTEGTNDKVVGYGAYALYEHHS